MQEQKNLEHDRLTQELLTGIEKLWPEEYNRVYNKVMGNGDIDPTFVGFIDIYEALSHVIPKHFTIFDVGCAYAFQAYYFRDHVKYVGIDQSPSTDELRAQYPCLECFDVDSRFQMPGAVYYPKTILCAEDLLMIKEKEVGREPSFAICSYVPGVVRHWTKQVFSNCFLYYPESSKEDLALFRRLGK